MRSKLILLALLLGVPACTDHCLRNSDCAAGQGCAEGMCAVITDLAAAPDQAPAPVPDLRTPDQALSDAATD